MIASPMSRRAVIGGVVGLAALSGCSLTNSLAAQTDTADRDRLLKAGDLSQQMLADIEVTTAQGNHLAATLLAARTLHATQVAQFSKSAKSSSPSALAGTPLTLKALRSREQALSTELRSLALQANRGDVAALLASGAAGIDQILAGIR